jgi:hypothetical protein
MAQGITTFKTLADAVAQGFKTYGRTADGYLVYKRIGNAMALAIVDTSL